jgi:hypothetical protein
MSTTLDWEQRRAILVGRIAREREELGEATLRLLRPVRRVERVTEQAGSVFRHLAPLWVPAALLLLLRPRRALRLVTRLFGAYTTFRRLKRMMG